MIDTGDIDVYLDLDVGKGEHHVTALAPAGKKTFDRRLPNSEPKLREVSVAPPVAPGRAGPYPPNGCTLHLCRDTTGARGGFITSAGAAVTLDAERTCTPG